MVPLVHGRRTEDTLLGSLRNVARLSGPVKVRCAGFAGKSLSPRLYGNPPAPLVSASGPRIFFSGPAWQRPSPACKVEPVRTALRLCAEGVGDGILTFFGRAATAKTERRAGERRKTETRASHSSGRRATACRPRAPAGTQPTRMETRHEDGRLSVQPASDHCF